MPDLSTSETGSDFVCDCEEWMRSACPGEPRYGEHEGKQYCVLHFPGREKSAEFKVAFQRRRDNNDFNFRGVFFPDNVSFAGVHFNAEANFSQATFSGAADFSGAIFNGRADFMVATFSEAADFSSVTINAEANFHNATFSAAVNFYEATFAGRATFSSATFGAVAHFLNAKFSAEATFWGASFSSANFPNATFSAGVDFINATFAVMANFNWVTFGGALANFNRATFETEAVFTGSIFSAAADFSAVTFSAGADFGRATFGDYLNFVGEKDPPIFIAGSSFDFQFARVEKPNHVSFHTLSLRPHWFVNVDPRKFDLTKVKWNWPGLSEEVESLKRKDVSSPHQLLAIACWNLSANAEDNHRYEEASWFRYRAMDARRREYWRGFGFWRLSWWYWIASGYGERILQAFLVLLFIWFVAGLLYMSVGFVRWEPRMASETDVTISKRDEVGAPLPFKRAFTYSLGVMTLQKPEPRPATTVAQTIVLFETILGPVQAALLALAIRRKFMR